MQEYSLSALIGVARTLGRSQNIDVTVSGTQAFTGKGADGRHHINIPVLTDDPNAFALARGYIDHEAGHALLTDMDTEKSVSIDDTMRGALHHIFNILEDGRIERKMADLYPGCRKNLHALNDLLMTQEEKGKTGPWQRIINWTLLETLAQNQSSMRPLADKARRKIDGALASAIVPEIQAAVVCPDSASCVKHALIVLNTVRQYAEQEQEQGGKGNRSQGQEGQDKGNGSQGEQGNGSTGSAGLQGQEGQDNGATGEKIIKGMERDSGDSEKDKAIQSMLNQAADSSAAADANAQHAGSGHKHFFVGDLSASDIHEALSVSAQMSARLTTLLQAATLARRMPSRRGRLNTRALHKSAYDTRLFLSRSEVVKLDTEVILLGDCSGSMYGPRIALMNKALYAVMHCLRRMRGITSSVYAYDDLCECVLAPDARLTKRLNIETAGGTSTGAALLWTMQRFGQDRTRRILILMTDGSTSDGELMRKAIDAAHDMGIELYGLGMQTDTLDCYPEMPSQAIQDMHELTGALFSLLNRVMF